MKQTRLWLATIATLLCSLAANAHDFEVGGIYYNITSSADLTVSVTYRGSSFSSYSDEYSGTVTIPETVTYSNRTYCVTSIGEYAFASCENVTSITIPSNVVTIELWAFAYCSSLTTFTIPANVTSIKTGAFMCENLSTLIIEDGTLPLSLGSFGYKYGDKGMGIFYECPLKTVYLGRNLIYESSNSKGYSPFYENNISDISIGDSVTSIGDCLFGNNYNLVSVNIPRNITSIGRSAFSGCNNLTSVTIPNSITSIKDNTFSGCSSLTSIVIPNSITSIESNAFKGCRNLVTITIPESVTSIGSDAFKDCSSLAAVHVSNIAAWCNIEFSNYVSNPLYYAKNLYLKGELVAELTIPESVTGIGDYAFNGCNNLHCVTIGNGVLSIGSNAFSTPEKVIWLTNTPPTGYVNANGSVNYVSNNQYSILSNVHVYPYLSSMFEVDGVKYVPVSPSERTCHAIDCAYDSAATAINVGETASFKGVAMKVTEVMPYAFYGNNYIKEVSVSHMGNIGNYAFYNCDSIKIVNVSNQGNIGNQAFYNCDGIKDVNISNLGDIGSQAFCNCDAIESVTISNQGDIGEQAFYDCNGIKTIEINNRGSIGAQAFYGCNRMETAVIANLAPVVSSNTDNGVLLTFADWTSTNKSHSTTSSNTYTFTAKDGAVLSFDWWVSSENGYDKLIATLDGTTILEKSGSLSGTYSNAVSQGEHTLIVKYTKDGSNSSGSDQAKVSNIVVSKGSDAQTIAGVGNEAFSGCSSLKTVTLGDSIGSLGSKAFYNCSSLQEIVIPDSVKTVGEYCFSGCSAMKSAVLGDGLANIAKYTFANCGLEEIIIGDNITSIGNYAFKGCSGMKSAVLGDGLTEVNGTMFDGCIGLEDVEIGNRITELEANAFSGCSSLSTITIPQNVTSIGDYAFKGCTGMKSAVLGDGLTKVNGTMFDGCIGLEKVEIGNNVRELVANAFSGCSSLSTITIPRAVTTIGDNAFAGCSRLSDVIISDRTTALALGSNGSSALFADCPLDSVYIGGKITYNTTSSKGYSPFYRNTSLRTVVITDREEQIYANEFYGCTNLQNVAIGNGVKSIGNYAFSGCSSLAGFSFGSSMETIGEEAFSDCTNLTSITSHAAVPPTCGTQALDDINKWECILSVPMGNADAYYAADQWKEFLFIEGMVEVDHYVLTYVVDGEVVHTEVLKHKDPVTMLAEPTKVGYEFSGWDKTIATMPAEDVVISGTFTKIQVDDLIIRDGEESFTVEEEQEYKSITYTRNFKNTNWQALYVPFEIPYEVIEDDFAVAYINDVHQFDDDDNGTIDRTRVEAIKVTGGVLKANYPYMIRAKVAGEKSITVTNATLYAAEENSIDCSSVFDTYTFTGTYSKIPAAELPKEEGYYALSGGSWKQFSSGATSSLGAFRIYMKIDSRDANAAIAGRAIEMRVIGDDEEETTGMEYIESTVNSQHSTAIYDLQGRRVEHPVKGLYIVNGEKVWIK